VRGIPSPFIKIYERGRDTPHPGLLPLLPRKDLFAGLLVDRGGGSVFCGGADRDDAEQYSVQHERNRVPALHLHQRARSSRSAALAEGDR
jgi:hypothetical protein